MNEQMTIKREALKELSKIAAEMVKNGTAESINDALQKMYFGQGHTVLKSFKKWREAGYSVRRGEKALLLWGVPLPVTKQEAQEGDKDEYKFFPLAFVFSDKQVERHYDKK